MSTGRMKMMHLAAVHELFSLLIFARIQHVVALGAKLDSNVFSLLRCHEIEVASQGLYSILGVGQLTPSSALRTRRDTV